MRERKGEKKEEVKSGMIRGEKKVRQDLEKKRVGNEKEKKRKGGRKGGLGGQRYKGGREEGWSSKDQHKLEKGRKKEKRIKRK